MVQCTKTSIDLLAYLLKCFQTAGFIGENDGESERAPKTDRIVFFTLRFYEKM